MTKEEFMLASTDKFGWFIDYRDVPDPVSGILTLYCDKHNDFTTTQDQHLVSIFGCPYCAKEYTRDINYQKLYFMVDYKNNILKLGISVSPRERQKHLGHSLVWYQNTRNAKQQEAEILRLTGEYFQKRGTETEYRTWGQLPIIIDYFSTLEVYYNQKIIKYYKLNLDNMFRALPIPALPGRL